MSHPFVIGEIFAGKYRLDRVLGEGGMGVVVAAHHLELDQPVAIKFLLDSIANNAEAAERFRREARAAAKIQSDHVVRVLDVGLLESGIRYMVMEYLQGRDLSEELHERGALGVEQVLGYAVQALDAIAEAHAAGIVHRDLKPANLFLARRTDGTSRVKVLDFGISKSLGGSTDQELSLTRTSAWVGSPLYMAPEQMQSARDVDQRADIWSMGAILYELLSGQPPYTAESLPQLCKLLLTTDPTPLAQLRPELPVQVHELVMRCLSRDLRQRFQSAAEVRKAVLATGMVPMYSAYPEPAPRQAPALAETEVVSPSPEPDEVATSPAASVEARTQGAWGRTGGAPHPRKRQVWLVAAALGGVALGGALMVARSGGSLAEGEETASEPSGAARPAAPEMPLAPAASPTENGASESDASEPQSEQSAPQPAIAAPEQPTPEVEQAAPTKPKPENPPSQPPAAPAKTEGSGNKPPATSPRPQPAEQPSPAPEAGKQTGHEISDFGGRR